jgi:hypothetical protein
MRTHGTESHTCVLFVLLCSSCAVQIAVGLAQASPGGKQVATLLSSGYERTHDMLAQVGAQRVSSCVVLCHRQGVNHAAICAGKVMIGRQSWVRLVLRPDNDTTFVLGCFTSFVICAISAASSLNLNQIEVFPNEVTPDLLMHCDDNHSCRWQTSQAWMRCWLTYLNMSRGSRAAVRRTQALSSTA